ncbi:MAG: class I SAM-dependent methyltransferase [Acidimicrobiia bacterium]|nr:class I SAM-dependent methyltransferase [Acidimicrobiia bacterium]
MSESATDWPDLTDWWLGEVATDPIYELDVLPLVVALAGEERGLTIDLGCGEGQVMRRLPGNVVGTDVVLPLLKRASSAGPVVQSRLPDLGWLRTDAVDTALLVLVLEHLPDMSLLAGVARVVKSGGRLVAVMNHPAFTAADAGPVMDPSDGEIFWRWGDYFTAARVQMETGAGPRVQFFHRPLSTILNAAADAGWMLERFVECGFSAAAIEAQPGYAGQEQMPRLLAVRWRRG